MKYTTFALLGVASMATAVPAIGMIGSLVGGMFSGGGRRNQRRDLEFESALLVIRDRTIQEWDAAVYYPGSISPEMLAALKQRGYTPPANIKATYVPSPPTPGSDKTLSKQYALKSVQAGYPIPPSTLSHMKAAGWKGPGLSKRAEFDFEELNVRGFEDEYLDLYAREFDEYDY